MPAFRRRLLHVLEVEKKLLSLRAQQKPADHTMVAISKAFNNEESTMALTGDRFCGFFWEKIV